MKSIRTRCPHPGIDPILLAPSLTAGLLLLIFSLLSSAFAIPRGTAVKLPRAITSDVLLDENDIISVSGEDVLYFNNRVVTIKELRRLLGRTPHSQKPILIKADRRATMGRIVDVWDLCRKMNLEKINIATSKEK